MRIIHINPVARYVRWLRTLTRRQLIGVIVAAPFVWVAGVLALWGLSVAFR